MISKTTNIAMFAVAAFALSGMMVAPAFAAERGTNNTIWNAPSGVPDTDKERVSCSGLTNYLITKVTPYSTSGGYVKVETNGSACKGFDKAVITVQLKGEGDRTHVICGEYTTTRAVHTTNFFGCEFEAGDKLIVLVKYHW